MTTFLTKSESLMDLSHVHGRAGPSPKLSAIWGKILALAASSAEDAPFCLPLRHVSYVALAVSLQASMSREREKKIVA